MRRARAIIILVALAITILFVWQANAPVFAKAPVPTCHGRNLLENLRTANPDGYAEVIRREKSVVNGQGLLWKIEHPGVAPSFLYGTMHMTDERLTTLPEPVYDALEKTRTVALEISEIVDKTKMAMAIARNISLLAYTDGRTLESVLSKKELALLKKTLSGYAMPWASSRIMKPWFVMLSLSLPRCEVERQKIGKKALDAVIAEEAKKNGARIVGLETVREQFSVFEALPEKVQKEFLMNSLRQHHLLEDQIETMKMLYLQRRPAALWEFALYLTRKDMAANKTAPDPNRQDIALLKKFEKELVLKRNKIMHDRALPLLADGKLFIAVGAAHLPGKHGLVALLQKSGYKVTRVY